MPKLKYKINDKEYNGKDFFICLFAESDDTNQYLSWCEVLRTTRYLDTTNNVYEIDHV